MGLPPKFLRRIPTRKLNPALFATATQMNIHIDFETYSPLQLVGPKTVGGWKYASDPEARILMAAVAVEDEPPALWIPEEHESEHLQSDPRASEIMQEWQDPSVKVWAHNAQFEQAVTFFRWAHDLPRDIAAPNTDQWRCTSVLARVAGLRSALVDTCEDLGLPTEHAKSSAGKALINLFSSPHKVRGSNQRIRKMPVDYPEDFAKFGAYCLQDVVAEQAVYRALKPFELKGLFLEGYKLDSKMNRAGVPVNIGALNTAQKIVTDIKKEKGDKFREITNLNHTQYQKVKAWLQMRGYPFEDMQSDTVAEALKSNDWDLSPNFEASEALQERAYINFAAVAKIKKMLEVEVGGFVRGTFFFYGALTGRWSGKLIQPQNFKRSTEESEDAIDWLNQTVSASMFSKVFDPPFKVLAECVRHFISHPNYKILDADFSGIEARIVNWLAGQEDALVRFRNNAPMYEIMGAKIFGVSLEDVAKTPNCRFVGKQAILGCGYGMGWEKFQATCAMYGVELTDSMCKKAVKTYRTEHAKVNSFWYNTETAARNAIKFPGKPFKCEKLTFVVLQISRIPFLLMKLPSGRCISYPHPRIEPCSKEQLKQRKKKGITSMDEITYYGKPDSQKVQWGRVGTYSGKLVENATQAVAADCMVNGFVNADREGMMPFMLVHDQALALATPGSSPERYSEALCRPLPWMDGLPLVAETNTIDYYKKD